MEVDTQPTHSATKFPTYVPLRKGKAKVPNNLDETKSSLQTPLLLDGIMFEGTHLGCMLSMKFKDWDLAKHEKFPHLETKNLMKQNTMGVVTALKTQKWLRRVEKVRLLNLLLLFHFHRSPITILFIRKLLYMVHDGCLWL